MWRRLQRLGVWLAGLLALPLAAYAGCSRTLRVPFEDWRPYSFMADGQHTGLETELLAAVAREAGCKVQYLRDIPRNRRLPLLLAGGLDVLVAATPRADAARYTRPYRDERLALFMRAEEARPELRTLDDVLHAHLRLVTHRGPANSPSMQMLVAQGRVTWFEAYALGVQLMQQRRGDVLLGDSVAIAYAARAADVPLVELPATAARDPVTYKLSPVSLTEADLQAFNRAIQHLEASGELQRIRERWLGAVARP